jgi:hypothetical protein
MKNAVFWDVAPCRSGSSLADFSALKMEAIRSSETSVHTQSAATCSRWFLARVFFYPEDGGDTFLQNVGSYKIYTAPLPRRPYSSQ